MRWGVSEAGTLGWRPCSAWGCGGLLSLRLPRALGLICVLRQAS